MDFETTYTSPRAEAARTLRGHIECHPRFAVKPDALAQAQAKQARAMGYEAPPTLPQAPQHIRRWVIGLSAAVWLLAMGGMALLIFMGQAR